MLLANSSRNPVNRKMRQRLVLSRSIVVLITETSESVLFVWPLRLWSLANHKQEVVVLWKCTGPHFIDFKTKACGPVKIWIFGHQPGLWTWLQSKNWENRYFHRGPLYDPLCWLTCTVDPYSWPVQVNPRTDMCDQGLSFYWKGCTKQTHSIVENMNHLLNIFTFFFHRSPCLLLKTWELYLRYLMPQLSYFIAVSDYTERMWEKVGGKNPDK